ncbi:hypothetical protein [Psychroflexus aurantiacus]|uniref:hypothetical protein n=1 Tax=Psychroflexus aurantiacus TaxID=2709310 RepID=UPI0013DC8103|nr:hypothetical protein [Psychroflexus aurantiacus]
MYSLFFTITPFYLIYCLVAHLGYLGNSNFYFYPDQGYFYSVSNNLGELNSFKEIIEACFINRVHFESEGAHFLFGSIAFIANKYFDGNSVLLQSLYVSFFAILSNLFVFKLLKKFLLKSTAKRYTLTFALLTPILFFSPWLLRDVHITFLFSVAIYLTFRKINLKNSILFFAVFTITSQFRMEHSLIILLFFIIHLYYNRQYSSFVKKYWSVFIFFGVGIITIILFTQSKNLFKAVETLDRYELHTVSELNDSGLGSKLYDLPFGIKHLAIAVNSQLTPLPPWALINFHQNIFVILTATTLGVVTIYWSYIFLFLLYSFTTEGIIRKLPKSLFLFLILVVAFLLLNSTNVVVRRIMVIYPVIFLIYAFVKEYKLNEYKKSIIHRRSVISYIFLLVIYILFKVFL